MKNCVIARGPRWPRKKRKKEKPINWNDTLTFLPSEDEEAYIGTFNREDAVLVKRMIRLFTHEALMKNPITRRNVELSNFTRQEHFQHITSMVGITEEDNKTSKANDSCLRGQKQCTSSLATDKRNELLILVNSNNFLQ